MERLLTVTEVAGILQISPGTLRNWCSSRQINFVKVNGAVRFDPSEISTFIKTSRVAAINRDDK